MISRTRDLTVEDFVATFEEHPEAFDGFDPAVARRWVETHLMDIVSRGKPSQAVAGLRPLHGFTYRFRNARRSRAYGADEQLYEMLSHAKMPADSAALGGLKDFFFAGVDARTEAPRLGDGDRRGDAGADQPVGGSPGADHRPTRHRPGPAVLPAAVPGGVGSAGERRSAGCSFTGT